MNDPKLTPEHEAAVAEAEEHKEETQPVWSNSEMPVLEVEQELDFDQEQS